MCNKQRGLPSCPIQEANEGIVTCLGRTFASEAERRAFFLGELQRRLADDRFRKRPGFPLANPEEILRLSDPPYYTACPNPFLTEYACRPGAAESPAPKVHTGDFECDARNPVYLYHPYHTKVPPDVVESLIRHYTQPGELVLDVFSGSGMTAVAASSCGRRAIVIDLSPVATFITGINSRSHDPTATVDAVAALLDASESELGWLFETEEKGTARKVSYFVRTDVFNCPECGFEFPFFPYGVIHHGNKVKTRAGFPCPGCAVELNVRRVERVLGGEGKKAITGWVKCGSGSVGIAREPNAFDRAVELRLQERAQPSAWFPTDEIDPGGYSAKLAQLGAKGIDSVAKFLSPRNRIIFADLWSRANAIEECVIRTHALSVLTSIFTVVSERQGYFGGGGGMSGNLYMPIVRMERNPWDSARRKLARLRAAEEYKAAHYQTRAAVSTQSATDLSDLPDDSVDYIYADPPFGANIIYSEMNLILEAWLEVKTEATTEAVVDESRERDGTVYGELMRQVFDECYRVLKTGRWITVEFHNTKATVWNLIQTALAEAGFVVAQVGVLNKGSTTILADIRPGAAKHDLLIQAYKPGKVGRRDSRVPVGLGPEEPEHSALQFITEHLRRVPVCGPDKRLEVAERLPHMLYDRYIAYFVTRGWKVPLSNNQLLALLKENLQVRDGMYFLPSQLPEYERRRGRAQSS